MKTYWSAFLSLSLLLILGGCGAEQFGTTPTSNNSSADALTTYQQTSCSGKTLIKPEVDILYVVDNSTSSYYVASDIKTGIQNTINSISSQFDYRVIGTPLIETTNGNNEYQVLSKSAASLPSSIPSSKIVTSASSFNFFSNIVEGSQERGLSRVQSFIASHQNDLFRQGAYLFVVLVSNGRDVDVESVQTYGGPTVQNTSVFNDRKAAFLNLKTYLNSQQLRLLTVTANTKCADGYLSSAKSYAAMSQALYDSNGLSTSSDDHYDLCGSNVTSLFAEINANIQQWIVPHSYKYWPVTSSTANIDTGTGRIQVLKVSSAGVATPMTSGWSYLQNPNYPGAIETRVDKDTDATIAGEPTSARHLIKFDHGSYITYPDCVSVTALSNTEYFGYVVLPKVPKLETVVLKINGQVIPQSTTNGWSFTVASQQTLNIKVPFGGYTDQPADMRTGYMLKLNGTNNYYKSGDDVSVYYIPATN